MWCVLLLSASATTCLTISDNGCCSRSNSSIDSQPSRLILYNITTICLLTYLLAKCHVYSQFYVRPLDIVLDLPGRAPVSAAMHDTLHWLSFPQHIMLELCLLTYKCLHVLAPDYLSRFCTLLTSVPSRPLLRSADANKLLLPWSCMTSFVLRSFATSGPTGWNDMSAHLHNLDFSPSDFRQLLKMALFQTVPV